MRYSVRGALVAAIALVLTLLAPVAARADGAFFARGGGGISGAPCSEAEPCNLAKAVKKAEEAGGKEAVVLLPGPTFTPSQTLIVHGSIDIGGEPGQARPTIQGPTAENSVILEGGAVIHDVDVIAGSSATGLELNSSSAYRVYSESVTQGFNGCLINLTAKIVDSVCFAQQDAGIFANVIRAELDHVDAIGGKGAGIEIVGSKFFSPGSYRVSAANSIIAGAAGYFDVVEVIEPQAEFVPDHSDYDSVGPGVVVPGANGSTSAPPQFVDPAHGDFHQLATSPTIDAGGPGTIVTIEGQAVGDKDLDGNPRALAAHPICGAPEGAPDIGAFEYQPLSCEPAPVSPPPVAPLGPVEPKPPAAPDTKLGKVKIDSAKGTAKFTFSGIGTLSGFQCELIRPAPKGARKGKAAKPKFAGCRSPKTYQHLGPGRYTFKVEAKGAGGTDATPATRKFRIAS
jgi:hypothetical protein